MSEASERRFLKTHEWHMLNGDVVTIGLSPFAVEELTDITYLEITAGQGDIKSGQAIGQIESVKATSDIYCGVDGKITQVNQNAIEDPSLINKDPLGEGWIVQVEPSDPSQLKALLTQQAYDQLTVGSKDE